MSRPNLSGRPRALRVNLAVAEALSWKWKRSEGGESPVDRPRWVLSLDGGDKPYAMWDDGKVWAPTFPDFVADPAAWGALVTAELCGLHQSGPGGPWKGQWWDEGKLAVLREAGVPLENARAIRVGLFVGPLCPTPGEAVCAAVLAKHGIDWLTLEAL